MRAHLRLATLSEPGKLQGWLFGIARMVFFEQLRKKRRDPLPPSDDEPVQIDRAPNPEAALLSREADQVLDRALEGLGEERRAALLMRLDHGLGYDEIADAMGWNLREGEERDPPRAAAVARRAGGVSRMSHLDSRAPRVVRARRRARRRGAGAPRRLRGVCARIGLGEGRAGAVRAPAGAAQRASVVRGGGPHRPAAPVASAALGGADCLCRGSGCGGGGHLPRHRAGAHNVKRDGAQKPEVADATPPGPDAKTLAALDRAETDYRDAAKVLEDEYARLRPQIESKLAGRWDETLTRARTQLGDARKSLVAQDVNARMRVLDGYAGYLRSLRAAVLEQEAIP